MSELKNYSYNIQSDFSIDEISGDIVGYDSLTEYATSEVVSTDFEYKKTDVEKLAETYDRFHQFYGWSYTEFESVPIEMLEALGKIIDKKMENVNNRENIFSIRYLETLLAIGHAFGGKK